MLKCNLERLLAERPRPMTKSAFARRLQVNRSYITLIEKGRRKPGSELLFRMARILECGVEDIFELLPDPEQKD